MLTWAAAYAGILLVAAAVVLLRREPTAVRGDWFFLFTAAFVLVALVASLPRGIELPVLLGAAVLLGAGWLARSHWLVVGADVPTVTATVEECAARLCAAAGRAGRRCTVTVPSGEVSMRLTAATPRATLVSFGRMPVHRKAELFRKLFAKQYRRVLPTIRIGPRP